MKSFRKILAASAVAALLSTQALAATTKPVCLTKSEASSLMAFAVPTVLSELSQVCTPHLSRDGFLAREGAGLIARYQPVKQAAWPQAKSAFFKLGQQASPEAAKMLSRMNDATLQPLAEAMVSEVVGGRIKPAGCSGAERVTQLLEPLPPEYAVELLGLALGLGLKADAARVRGKIIPFNICPAG